MRQRRPESRFAAMTQRILFTDNPGRSSRHECHRLPEAHDDPDRRIPRPRQRHPRARDGRRPDGQLRPPRHADGHGGDRRGAVAPAPAPQPGQSALGRPRPLRALQRPRLDAAVRAAAPHRLRPADGGPARLSASCIRKRRDIRKSASRPAWRPPPARSARGSPTRSAWRSPSGCWPPSSTGPGHTIVDHHTYVFLGDGCLMEGISHEACSLAGTLELGKLIAFYDDNGISIDGKVEGWFTDDTPMRFAAYGWHVIPNVDGHDAEGGGRRDRGGPRRFVQPTLICCKTVIGKGSPNKAGTDERTARRWARRKSPPRARRSAGRTRRSRFPRPSTRPGTRASAAPGSRTTGTRVSPPTRRRTPISRRSSAAAWPATCRPTGREVVEAMLAKAVGEGRDRRHAQGLAARDRGARAAPARAWSAARPTSPAPISPTGRARKPVSRRERAATT